MILAKVKGNVVSSHKDKELKSHKLMIIHPIDLDGNFIAGQDIVAIDFSDCGIGDTVIVVQEGDAVQQILGHNKAPVHTIIVGVVDKVDYNPKL